MKSMGPLKNMFGMMGVNNVPKEVMEQGEEKLKKYKVIIGSMSKAERKNEQAAARARAGHQDSEGAGVQDKDVRAYGRRVQQDEEGLQHAQERQELQKEVQVRVIFWRTN